MSFNKITIVGYLGRDPELRYTAQNVPVCTFSIATSERKRDAKSGSDPAAESTTWFRVTLWREKAELASKYLAKGRQVYVEGRLSVREWQDRDGVTRTSLEVTGTELHFIDTRNEAGGGAPSQGGRESLTRSSAAGSSAAHIDTDARAEVDEDDIPF
ncbi:MAG TPA: single-stranded DNA-binding protein [Acidobacteriota bacterium]|nr:single-stranded DNA-binding protein [Acidobacteriota bacterium]HNJ39873.1 single-stranded DNA-binding protein [Acidobacteriota bacterium]